MSRQDNKAASKKLREAAKRQAEFEVASKLESAVRRHEALLHKHEARRKARRKSHCRIQKRRRAHERRRRAKKRALKAILTDRGRKHE